MIHATLCFLLRGDPPPEILLGRKKTGLGAGKINGIGGKVEPGETPVSAAAREVREEIGVEVALADLEYVCHITFDFPAKPEWDQIVHVYLARHWRGNPRETVEMAPMWCALADIPFAQMWQDDQYWLPRVLAGEKVRAEFTFADDNETIAAMREADWA